jgi:hypothetical protein
LRRFDGGGAGLVLGLLRLLMTQLGKRARRGDLAGGVRLGGCCGRGLGGRGLRHQLDRSLIEVLVGLQPGDLRPYDFDLLVQQRRLRLGLICCCSRSISKDGLVPPPVALPDAVVVTEGDESCMAISRVCTPFIGWQAEIFRVRWAF